jgi:hypothetical protein
MGRARNYIYGSESSQALPDRPSDRVMHMFAIFYESRRSVL